MLSLWWTFLRGKEKQEGGRSYLFSLLPPPNFSFFLNVFCKEHALNGNVEIA